MNFVPLLSFLFFCCCSEALRGVEDELLSGMFDKLAYILVLIVLKLKYVSDMSYTL